jgi:hypothetical protein
MSVLFGKITSCVWKTSRLAQKATVKHFMIKRTKLVNLEIVMKARTTTTTKAVKSET